MRNPIGFEDPPAARDPRRSWCAWSRFPCVPADLFAVRGLRRARGQRSCNGPAPLRWAAGGRADGLSDTSPACGLRRSFTARVSRPSASRCTMTVTGPVRKRTGPGGPPGLQNRSPPANAGGLGSTPRRFRQPAQPGVCAVERRRLPAGVGRAAILAAQKFRASETSKATARSPGDDFRARSLRRRTVQTPRRVGWAPSGAEGDDWRARNPGEYRRPSPYR